MTTRLKKYFPIIREREEILAEIESNPYLSYLFQEWKAEQRMEFLDFCTGVRGIKFLYDSFFKEIMNPELVPERMEEFLSLLLKKNVKILEILPTDSTRLADESSLLVMDIVVQLEDGPIVNLEVQKIGYKFPGERCACYSSDLLLRQYKRVRSKKKKKFSYKEIKGVYTIVLFEESPKEFQEFYEIYRHGSKQVFDTGLKINLLQEYVFIALDIYKKIYQNKINNKCERVFDNKLEAWLAFLCMDDPEVVIRLIEEWPEFKEMYGEAYQLCLNTEEVMQMYSRELAELDRNTVQLMIDEMQDEINEKKQWLNELAEEKARIEEEKKRAVEEKTRIEEEKKRAVEEKTRIEEEKKRAVEEKTRIEEEKKRVVEEKTRIEEEKKRAVEEKTRIEEEKKRAVEEKMRIEEEKKKAVEEKTKKVQDMLCMLYNNLQDIDQVAQLSGCSVEEVQAAVNMK